MIKHTIIVLILFILIFIGCGGKSSKETCEAQSGTWKWNETEKKCEQVSPAKTIGECEAQGGKWNISTSRCEDEKKVILTQKECETRGGKWNISTTQCEDEMVLAQQDCETRGGIWDVSTAQCEGALRLSQAECETKEKKKEGFGWVNGRCEERAIFVIYSYMVESPLLISSGGKPIELQPFSDRLHCVRMKKSQWPSLKITIGVLFTTVCDNTDNSVRNDCNISPSIYNEEEGTHKYRVQLWGEFVKLLSGGDTEKDISHCETLTSEL